MNLRAAGAYLNELRHLHGYSQARVGTEAGVTNEIVLRVEKGRGETAGSVLLKMLRFLGGSCEQYLQIVTDETVSEEQARAMAKAWFERADDAVAEPSMSKKEQDAERLLRSIMAIAELGTIEERAAALRELPAWMFRVIEALALDLMRSTVRRE